MVQVDWVHLNKVTSLSRLSCADVPSRPLGTAPVLLRTAPGPLGTAPGLKIIRLPSQNCCRAVSLPSGFHCLLQLRQFLGASLDSFNSGFNTASAATAPKSADITDVVCNTASTATPPKSAGRHHRLCLQHSASSNCTQTCSQASQLVLDRMSATQKT